MIPHPTIPENCIETFIKKFNHYPSIIEVDLSNVNNIKLDELINKYQLIWFNSKTNLSDKLKIDEMMVEYDPVGVLIYRKNNDSLFILTTIDRRNVSEYLINIIKRLK